MLRVAGVEKYVGKIFELNENQYSFISNLEAEDFTSVDTSQMVSYSFVETNGSASTTELGPERFVTHF